ncbi:MAG: TVP38/TMEM64 family protein, partial [Gammaproteobacteria bacterium]
MNSVTRRLHTLAPRLVIVVVIVAAVVLFYRLGGGQWLDLKHLLAERGELYTFVQQHYLMALLIAGLAYMLMAALSIPGGTVLSLLIGFLFGLWAGGTLIVIAATLGATIIFLIVRYLIGAAARTWLKKKPQAEKLLAGFERDAFNYLLFVRFVPLFPFWLVNLASAFTAISLRQYMLGTFVGII